MDEYSRSSGRQSSRPILKFVLSGKSTPRGSPSFRRLSSSRTPRRDVRSSGFNTNSFRSNMIFCSHTLGALDNSYSKIESIGF
ncbi:hypothetical protein HanPSC8_Chr05g0217131 [Helianthus annuus]|nr:hypothetical protein HanPSC8_Chr05g0217131 [Helianthus annuus]